MIAGGVNPQDVYVVNDASTDRTAQVARAFPLLNVLTNDQPQGKLAALKGALERFGLLERYDFLAVLDADSHVSSNYFAEVAASFKADPQAVLVCGAPQSERHNWLTAYRALEYGITLWIYRTAQDRLGVITVAPGCASTYRTRVVAALDWSGQTLVEDMDLTIQVHRKRLGRIAYAPRAVTYTQDPRSLSEYWGQVTRWYRGTWQVARLHRLPFGGQRIDAEFGLLISEGLAYSTLTLLLPWLLWTSPALVVNLLLVDQAISAVLAVVCSIRLRRADILIAFPAFLFVRLLNCVILLRTFVLEILLRKREHRWYSVPRYSSSDSLTTSSIKVIDPC